MSTPEQLSIERLTTASDEALQAVRYLYPQLTDGPIPDADALTSVLEGSAVVLVARLDGRIVGMATLAVARVLSSVTAHIEDVVVDAGHRRRGIGQRLMNELIAYARAHGVDGLALTSRPSREAANRLYQRLGFKPGGTNYYWRDV